MTFGESAAGVDVVLSAGDKRPEEALFGEGGGRILVELSPEAAPGVESLAQEAGVGAVRLGKTGGQQLKLTCGPVQESWAVAELRKFFETSLPNVLGP
jgi:phosphoribosylformylglycinamidine (FGAM) synthase-like enzyme